MFKFSRNEWLFEIILITIVTTTSLSWWVAFGATQPTQPFSAAGTFGGIKIVGYTSNLVMRYDFRSSIDLNEVGTGIVGGAWNGPLPEEGTYIFVSSPTGLMRDVRITDLGSGRVYRSQGRSVWPGKPEDVEEFDSFDAAGLYCCKS